MSEIQRALKKEVIDIYSRILEIVVSKTTPILGETTVTAVLGSALNKASKKFDFLNKFEISKGIISPDVLKEQLEGLSKDVIRDGFEELIAQFFDVLRALTGDVLVTVLKPEIEKVQFKKSDPK